MKRIYKTVFHAAHFLKGHSVCGKLHGHSYTLLVKIPDKTGKFLDFHKIREIVDEVLEDYDHKNLGNKTCEDLGKEIKNRIQSSFVEEVEVELWETEHFGVEIS